MEFHNLYIKIPYRIIKSRIGLL